MEIAYAQALAKMIERGMKPEVAVSALRGLLARFGREKLLPKIGRAFERIAKRENNRNGIVLTTARESDNRVAQKEASAAISHMEADMKDVSMRVDESLIGGWRLEGRDCLIDASFKKDLLSLYNRATQS